MDTSNPIGKNLGALIKDRDTTRSAVASVAGASNAAVTQWLSGENWPGRKYLNKIADYYGISVDDLISESNGYYARTHRAAPAGAIAPRASLGRMVSVRVPGSAHATEFDDAPELEETVELLESIAQRHPDCYALRIRGDCMNNCFTEQDYIFVDPNGEPIDGSIVVAEYEGETTVRRVRRGSNTVMLVADSTSNHEDIVISNGELHCQGTVFWWQAAKEQE